jgi:hypothetical protein
MFSNSANVDSLPVFLFLHALPHFCICSRISFLANIEFNVLAGNPSHFAMFTRFSSVFFSTFCIIFNRLCKVLTHFFGRDSQTTENTLTSMTRNLETEGHVGSEDNVPQINTGRLDTYIQSATCGASVQHGSHINTVLAFSLKRTMRENPCGKCCVWTVIHKR